MLPYVPSELRAALRRAGSWRAARRAAGLEPPFERSYAAHVLRRGRAAGLLRSGRRRVDLRFELDPASAEAALRRTGARTIPELVLVTLMAAILEDCAARARFADRRPRRARKRRRSSVR